MKYNPEGTSKLTCHKDPVKKFTKRMIIVLTALFWFSLAIIMFLIYRPFKVELEKSLIDNFSQNASIRYAALQGNINRGLEGARSLSSRTVIL